MGLNRQEISWLLAAFREGRISEDAVISRLQPLVPPSASSAEGTVDLRVSLDQFRAAEVSGAETLRRWALVAADPVLVGGLRVAAARESQHASLLEQRLRELGGEPSAEIPSWLRELNSRIADPAARDTDRLSAIVEYLPDSDRGAMPVHELVESACDDLTAELLRNICADDLITTRWLHEAYRARRG